MVALPVDWDVARRNQRALMAEVAAVRASLERHAGRMSEPPLPDADAGAPCALDGLAAAFSLSPFERKILVACAAIELDGAFSSLCALAQGDAARAYPTFGLALAVFEDAHWSALLPQAPLRRWSLVTLGRDAPLTAVALRIDETVLHEMAGVASVDARLTPYLAAALWPDELAPSQRAAIDPAVAVLSGTLGGAALVQLSGPDIAANRAIADAVFAQLGAPAVALDARALPRDPLELERLLQAWSREMLLHGSALYLDAHGLSEAPDLAAAIAFAERAMGRIIVGTDVPLTFERRCAYGIPVGRPNRGEQRRIWQRAFGEPLTDESAHAGALLSAQFDFSGDRIRVTAGLAQGSPAGELSERAWAAAGATARAGLDTFAERLDCRAAPGVLVLPQQQSQTLDDIVACARNRARVYDDWDMAGGPRGRGLSALFAGPSGTGKTLAAEAIGAALALDVYRIDLSALVSKYIGETEKNLRRVFDAAEAGGAVLLFDECDALFGKRGEVQQAHDRYANVEVSYLLARMETYRGLAILTTNMRGAIDPAFMRRIRFVITFPFPDYEQRVAIWQRSFGPSVPTDGLDFAKTARLNVAGGNIRNIALHAAFLAADAGLPVTMEHILRAARAECRKIERTPSDLEIGGWI